MTRSYLNRAAEHVAAIIRTAATREPHAAPDTLAAEYTYHSKRHSYANGVKLGYPIIDPAGRVIEIRPTLSGAEHGARMLNAGALKLAAHAPLGSRLTPNTQAFSIAPPAPRDPAKTLADWARDPSRIPAPAAQSGARANLRGAS